MRMEYTRKTTISFWIIVSLSLGSVSGSVIRRSVEKSLQSGDVELPAIQPKNYVLTIHNIDLDKRTYEADLVIDLEIHRETQEIKLNQGNLKVSNVTVRKTSDFDKLDTSFDLENELLIIKCPKLEEGSQVQVIIVLADSPIRNDEIGFYIRQYRNENGETKSLALTNFNPANARHVFPCFDEPNIKATFQINIDVPKGYGALSNMPNVPQDDDDENSEFIEFEPTEPLSTHQISFIVSDLVPSKKAFWDNVEMKIWTRKVIEKQGNYALWLLPAIINGFEDLTGIKYPLSKLDIVAVPGDVPTEMGNLGLLLMPESSILVDLKVSSESDKLAVERSLRHAVGSMWFRSLLTPKDWEHSWLLNGFVKFYEYYLKEEKKSQKHDQLFRIQEYQSAMVEDSFESAKALSHPVGRLTNKTQISDSLMTKKAASIVRMMRQGFTPEVFDAAIKKYFSVGQNKGTEPADFWNALQDEVEKEAPEVNVTEVMTTWVTNPGYPIVNVQLKNGTLRLEQQRFYQRKEANPQDDTLWSIPIWFHSNHLPEIYTKSPFWFFNKTREWSIPVKEDGLVLVKSGTFGYYRVNYSKSLWDKIIESLNNDGLSGVDPVNRGAIIDDLMNFVRADLIDYDTALRALKYIERETEPEPMIAALKGLSRLYTRILIADDDDLAKIFSDYIKSLTKMSSLTEIVGDFQDVSILKILSRFCELDESCMIDLRIRFKKWKSVTKSSNRLVREVTGDWKPYELCMAIKDGDEDDLELMSKRYQASKVASERSSLMRAMGCTTKFDKLSKIVKENAFSDAKASDLSNMIENVYSQSPAGAYWFVESMPSKFNDVENMFFSNDRLRLDMIKKASNIYPTKQMSKLVKKQSKIDGANKALYEEILRNIESEQDWTENKLPTIAKSLRENIPETTTERGHSTTATPEQTKPTSTTTESPEPITPETLKPPAPETTTHEQPEPTDQTTNQTETGTSPSQSSSTPVTPQTAKPIVPSEPIDKPTDPTNSTSSSTTQTPEPENPDQPEIPQSPDTDTDEPPKPVTPVTPEITPSPEPPSSTPDQAAANAADGEVTVTTVSSTTIPDSTTTPAPSEAGIGGFAIFGYIVLAVVILVAVFFICRAVYKRY